MNKGVRCEVNINDVTIVQKSEYQCKKRFSDFVQFRKDIEYACRGELPYDLPGRKLFWGRKASSTDPNVIEERRNQLRQFLQDLLNDSFETKWRNSHELAHFLNLPDGWYTKSSGVSRNSAPGSAAADHSNGVGFAFAEADVNDPSVWLNVLREAKSEFINESDNAKTVMKLRLVLSRLEQGLTFIDNNDLVSRIECERRRQLLTTFKSDLNESVTKSTVSNDNNSRMDLFSGRDDRSRYDQPRIGSGRKLGETKQTEGLDNQQLLQLHKDAIQDQDQELIKLHKIVQQQKNISVALNQELEAQNELLDLFQDETQQSSNKLRAATRNAVRFNQGNSS